jgi:hypothetical protein
MKTYGLTESVTGASASASRCLPTPKKLASGGAVGQSRGMEVRRPREGARLGLFKNKAGQQHQQEEGGGGGGIAAAGPTSLGSY